MHGIFYIHHLVINSDSWVINFFVTVAGVGIALALQELLNWFHRRENTLKYALFLIEEITRNLEAIASIIQSCTQFETMLENPENTFGLGAASTISGVTSSFRKGAYESVKQNESNLNLSPEISLSISKAYSRMADIGLFISTIMTTWNLSEAEAEREGVAEAIVDQQRQQQIRIIVSGTKALSIEVQADLNQLLIDLRRLRG